MDNKLNNADLKLGLLWAGLLALAIFLYSMGMSGRFYFDDYGTLPALAENGGVDDWSSLRSFVFGNETGPSGRPISLLSFLINDNGWPSSARSFKYTNVMLHLLNGTLLLWCVLLLKKVYEKRTNNKFHWSVPALIAGLWMFNPIHASTVFYVVQRMTELSAFFVMLGIVAYIKGRLLADKSLGCGLALMLLGIVVCTVLAVYSKESGALLPTFLLIIDVTFFKRKEDRNIIKALRWGLLVGPTIVIVGIVIYKASVNGWTESYPVRDFSPIERLLTQPFIVLSQLKDFFFPELYSSGIYHDDMSVSTIISNPVSIFALFFIVPFLIFLCHTLTKLPVFTFPFLFFFSGHLIESTAIGLELAFEHRNYMPSTFLGFVPVAVFGALAKKNRLVKVVPCIMLLAFIIITGFRAELWGKPLDFALYGAKQSPDSGRAQIEAGNALVNAGHIDEALRHTIYSMKRIPDNSSLRMQALLIDCIDGHAEKKRLNDLLELERKNGFDGRNYLALDAIWEHVSKGTCDVLTPENFKLLLDAYESGVRPPSDKASSRALAKYKSYWSIRFAKDKINSREVDEYLFEKDDQPESLMVKASLLASEGQHQAALRFANKAKRLVSEGNLGYSNKMPEDFLRNINEFMNSVKRDIERQK